jgi:hypothetical protein
MGGEQLTCGERRARDADGDPGGQARPAVEVIGLEAELAADDSGLEAAASDYVQSGDGGHRVWRFMIVRYARSTCASEMFSDKISPELPLGTCFHRRRTQHGMISSIRPQNPCPTSISPPPPRLPRPTASPTASSTISGNRAPREGADGEYRVGKKLRERIPPPRQQRVR